MTIQPPNYAVPVVDDQRRMTPQFLKFLEALGNAAAQLDALPGSRLSGSAVYDPPNLISMATVTTTVTVTGAALGMACEASFSLDTQGIMLDANVQSANTVAVTFFNPTAGALNLASGTLRAYAWTPA